MITFQFLPKLFASESVLRPAAIDSNSWPANEHQMRRNIMMMMVTMILILTMLMTVMMQIMMMMMMKMKMLATLSCSSKLSSHSAHYGWLNPQQDHLMIMMMTIIFDDDDDGD